VPAFRLACLAYFSLALPASPFGLLWPSIRLSFHQPLAALGVLLVFGVAAEVVASAAAGRLLSRLSAGLVLALSTTLTGLALLLEAFSPSLPVFGGGMVIYGLGFGGIDTVLNAHAALHFSVRQINWIHAAFGAGATVGPVLVAALLDDAVTWRWIYGAMGVVQIVFALVFAITRRAWSAQIQVPPHRGAKRARPQLTAVLGSLIFIAVENGIESGAGVWGYVFLTDGRGLGAAAAGTAVSGYWAMMFVGRAVLGPVAQRVGRSRVLGAAVVGVSLGCAIMAVPGPSTLAVVGLLLLGVAAAPIFPLFTLATAQRTGSADAQQTTETVGLQVAASAIGSAALPAGFGLAIGALTAKALAPLLLLLGLAMCAVYRRLS
jgi:fucose permease